MRQRHLGRNGPPVSAVGLGCMGMSIGKQPADDAESIATIHAALDTGITYLDTGDFYGMGHNEMLVGAALKGRRQQAMVGVKFGALRSHTGAFIGYDARPVAVKNFAAYSLRRLGVEVIDLYQPARVDPAVPLEETVGAVADLIREGKVRHLGMSEVTAEQLRRAHAVHPVSALQIEYSLSTRFIEAEILPTARELGIAIVAYGVFSRGLLTGTMETAFGPGDFRAHTGRFQGDNLTRNLANVEVLKSLAARKGCTPAELALAWVLARGDDVIPLIGVSSRARLTGNLGGVKVALDKADLAEIDRLLPPGAFPGDRYPKAQMAQVAR
jgi:aryl-alcohol dehydrogenase-like predicted oxidoreductase